LKIATGQSADGEFDLASKKKSLTNVKKCAGKRLKRSLLNLGALADFAIYPSPMRPITLRLCRLDYSTEFEESLAGQIEPLRCKPSWVGLAK